MSESTHRPETGENPTGLPDEHADANAREDAGGRPGEDAGEHATALPQAAAQTAWPERVEVGERQVAYRLRVKAGADALWALLADPHRHHEVDGSGTVKPTVQGPHRLAVGDRFKVHMKKYRMPYVMPLTVTAADPDRLIEWAHPAGHRWRWEFQDNGDGTTDVTETFDYSWVSARQAKVYELLRLQRENGRGITASLTRLAARHA